MRNFTETVYAKTMRYKAFISYSHAADGKLAPAIQRALHRIAKPWYKLRAMRVFRDQTNLATSPGLWTSIESALRDAEFFVYMASPAAAQSPWVQKEVSWWLTNRSYQTFLILLTDGEIVWDNANQDLNWTATNALPRQLAKVFTEEPLYTDLRWARKVEHLSPRHAQFRTVLLDLAATLLNRAKDELDGDDIRQYRRTRRIASSAVIVLSVLLVAALLAAYFATQQTMLATARALSAQSEALLPTDPELALLLAREALKYKQDDQAEFALRQAFIRNPERMIHHLPRGGALIAEFLGSNTIVAAEVGKKVSAWDVATGQRVADLPTEAFLELTRGESADHSIVAFPGGSWGSGFTLYDTKTWKPLPTLPGTDPRISRDGTVLTAVEVVGKRIHQWTLPSLTERNVNAEEGYIVRDVSDDGGLLFLTQGATFASALVIEATSGKIRARIPERMFPPDRTSLMPTTSSFSPDGRFLVTRQVHERVFEIWDTQSASVLRTFQPIFNPDGIWFVEFSPNSKILLAGDGEGELQGLLVETGDEFRLQSSQHNAIKGVRFSPDGASMLTVSGEGTVCLWDTENMRCLVTFGEKGDEAFDAAFASDSRHFLTTHIDGTVRVWDRHMWQRTQSRPFVNTVVSGDGKLALSADEAGSVSILDAENGHVKASMQQTPGEIEHMAMNQSGSLVAIAPKKGVVGLWNAQTGLPAIKLDESSADTNIVRFDTTGTQLATGSKNGTVRFWSTSDGKLLGEWQAQATKNEQAQATDNEIRRIVFHPDGERIITAQGRTAWVRERKSGKGILQIDVDEGQVVDTLALNADGSLLIVTGGLLPEIWDLNSYKRVGTLEGHIDEVYDAAFSHDGRWMLTCSNFEPREEVRPPDDANSVFVWDAKTGRRLLSYRSAGNGVQEVRFSNDGRGILAGGEDDKELRYECPACLPLPELLQLVSAKTSRELTADERARYLSEGTLLGWIMRRLAS